MNFHQDIQQKRTCYNFGQKKCRDNNLHFRYSRTYSNLFKTNLQKDYKPLVIASDSLLVQLEKTVLIQPEHLKKLIMVTVIILIIQ